LDGNSLTGTIPTQLANPTSLNWMYQYILSFFWIFNYKQSEKYL